MKPPRFDPNKGLSLAIDNPYMGDYPAAHTAIVKLVIDYGAAQQVLYDLMPEWHRRQHRQSSFARDLNAARRIYGRKSSDAKEVLREIDDLRNRCGWIRNAIVHGNLFKEMRFQPDPTGGKPGYSGSWTPTGEMTYFIKSGKTTIRLDDSDRLNQSARDAEALLLATYRFRALV